MKTDEQIREIAGKECYMYRRSPFAATAEQSWIRGYKYAKNEPAPPLKPLSELTEEHAVEICRIENPWLLISKETCEITRLGTLNTLFVISGKDHEWTIGTNGDVQDTFRDKNQKILNQAQIIKFYLDNGYDIFGQNKV